MASYLNSYKHVSLTCEQHMQDSALATYGRPFFSYLLSICWKKMHSRISSWPAVGFIYGIHKNLEDGVVTMAVRKFPWSSLPSERGPDDRTLACALHSAKFAIPDVVGYLPEQYRSLTKLMSTVESAVECKDYRIYDQSTALEFHCLLLGTFLGWAHSLAIINEHIKASPGHN